MICGQVVGHDEASVVVTGILPVFAFAERLVMWTNMTEWKIQWTFTLKGNCVLAESNRKQGTSDAGINYLRKVVNQ